MREIKFRAWDNVKEKWIEYPDIRNRLMFNCVNSDGKHWWLDDVGGYPIGRDIILMQYTGLHDKNGKEIYDGDILLNHASTHKDKRQVTYENGCPSCAYGSFNKKGWKNSEEVIGNIHENGELLNP